MSSVEQVVAELTQARFYGSLEIKFEAGKVVLLRKTETIRPNPEDYRNNRGDKHEHAS